MECPILGCPEPEAAYYTLPSLTEEGDDLHTIEMARGDSSDEKDYEFFFWRHEERRRTEPKMQDYAALKHTQLRG
jgi:hypothetical protein